MKHTECYKDSFVKIMPNGTTGMDVRKDVAQIVEVGRSDVKIKFADEKEPMSFYAVHLYQDNECIRKHRAWREQRAQKIGGRYMNQQAMR
jgi:hypothetical protein